MRFHGTTVFSLSSPFTLPPTVYQLKRKNNRLKKRNTSTFILQRVIQQVRNIQERSKEAAYFLYLKGEKIT